MKISKEIRVLKVPQKFPGDQKEYKLIQLENELKVLLIKQKSGKDCGRNSKLKQNLAAVALCVSSGCFDDPQEVQGLSHFLEHMIFMGSEKYPKENEFDQFVSAHGGFDNAYTEHEYTLFHFDIIEKHLAGALDRFSQFFVSPLMSFESMDREMEAVESEFQCNSSDDDVRLQQIFCSMVKDNQPASKFIWGNFETLKYGIKREKLSQKLHEFRKQNYVANRMFLCIQSSVDMNRLERTIVKCFKDIPKSIQNIESVSVFNEFEVFKSEFSEKAFFVQSNGEKCKLLMTFLYPALEGKEIKFLDYLASLIHSEESGSLSDVFIENHLALRVKTRIGNQSFESNFMFTLFSIEINLTTKGFEQLEEVLNEIFAFLLLIKTTSINEHRTRYNEFVKIKNLLSKNRREKSALVNVQELAVNMKFFDDENVVIGNEICGEFNEKVLQNFIDRLNERKFNIMILSDKISNTEKREKWFGTRYSAVDLPKYVLKLWNERWLHVGFVLPKPNNYICENFELFESSCEDESSAYPRRIFHNDACQCFHLLDNKFKLPLGFIYVYLMSEITESTVQNLNMTSIYSMCVKNFLSKELYPATIAGYNYKLHSVDDGLVLRTNGFNAKLPSIVDIITKTMNTFLNLIDLSVFETFKRELKKNFNNCLADENLLNDDYRLSFINSNHRSFQERLDNIDLIDFKDFTTFCENFLKSLKAKILIQGNFTESNAISITQMIIGNLNIKENKEAKMKKKNLSDILRVPIGSSYLKIQSSRQHNNNSLLKNYYQIGKATIQKECIAETLVGMMYEPLFDALRSHEQLGYGVACTLRKNSGIIGITITVEYQENRHSSEIVDKKIEEFLNKFYKIFLSMSDKEFSSVKSSLTSIKLVNDTDLEQEVVRNWNEIRIDENIFDRNELEAFEIEKLTKKEIEEFYFKTFLSIQSVRKLSVQVIHRENCKVYDKIEE
ncbi:CLUMA_CG014688, isoform A [Clunio marinus]|uniref:CLUMA_CG014688, isoform A n=1 Tax=Clunio marinus TaxID=568069 RepID=A0A1J1IM96_9DIPT|nr:CLUMA_CG014688, isoform A [Clunio marinus]